MQQRNTLVAANATYIIPDGAVYHVLPSAGAKYTLTANGVPLPDITVSHASPSKHPIVSTAAAPVTVTAVNGSVKVITYTGSPNNTMRPLVQNRKNLEADGEFRYEVQDGFKYEIFPEAGAEYTLIDSLGTELTGITVPYGSLPVISLSTAPVVILCTQGALKLVVTGPEILTEQNQGLDALLDAELT